MNFESEVYFIYEKIILLIKLQCISHTLTKNCMYGLSYINKMYIHQERKLKLKMIYIDFDIDRVAVYKNYYYFFKKCLFLIEMQLQEIGKNIC